MDVFSHALWGYAALRWRGPRSARWGLLIGAAPDLLYFGADLLRRAVLYGWAGVRFFPHGDPTIWRRDGPPMPQDLLDAYEFSYVWTHSFVVLGTLAVVWLILRSRAPWLFLAWGLHILMDMPTHERYLTPFLFPLSRWTVEGYAWNRPPLLAGNFAALLITYAVLFWRYWRPGRPARARPWPEEAAGGARRAATVAPAGTPSQGTAEKGPT